MTIHFYLDTRKKRKRGFPIVINFAHKGKTVQRVTGLYSEKKHWRSGATRSHPQYDFIKRKLEDFRGRMFKAEGSFTYIPDAIGYVFNENRENFYNSALNECKAWTGRTKEGYLTALTSFNQYFPDIDFNSVSPRVVRDYMAILKNKGFTSSTIHTYLRKLDTLWKRTEKPDNPFKGIRPRLEDTKDKFLSDLDVCKIRDTRTIVLPHSRKHSINLLNRNRYYWLLMFYLGGIDMFDLKKMRYDKHVVNGRIEFKRGKGNSGVFCSNKIFPEALEILKRFDCKPYLVPVFEQKNYTSFVSNFNNRFPPSVVDLELSRRPLTKSARYTFINRGKMLMIDERVVRQLVGHSENSVHSIYSGRYSYDVTDKAHEEIIRF